MTKLCITICVLFYGLATWAQPRQTYSFNAGWKIHKGDLEEAQQPTFDDTEWRAVTLPYAWNEDEAFAKPIHEHSTGVVWYRKTFILPDDVPQEKVFLEFEGVRFGAEFYLNGTWIGRHENGVMAAGLDISQSVLRKGENVIAIRTDNDWRYREKATNSIFQWNDKNFNANYGGIPKNVWIHFTGGTYQTLPLYSNLGTTGVYVYAQNIDISKKRLDLHVESEVKNETSATSKGQFLVEVRDLEGRLVHTFESPFSLAAGATGTIRAESKLDDVNFWNWGYGYLYTVTTKLVVDGETIDVVDTRTGFRKTAFRDGMVFINDQVLMMKGYAQRTSNEWPAVGLSVAPWLSDYSNKLMVESNANLVRWMHVAPWRQDVESCDRVGLMQMLPAGDAERDVDGRRWEQRTELMRDAIIYYRNNPSVIFWESGNESISEEHMAEMIAIRDQYDPHGGRAVGSREMLDSKLAEYGGEMLYINKSGRHPMIATEYMRDEGLRKYWDEHTYPFHKEGEGPLYKGNDAGAYNRNQDQHAMETVRRWWEYWKVRPGTGKRVSSGGVNIIFSDSNTHYRGKENYRRSGEVDAMRIPKDAYYAHQVMWDGWIDPDPKGLHIIGHWNYAPHTKKDIHVVSAGEQVELFVNGQSQGFGARSYQFLFTFPQIAFVAGELKARSYNENGEVLNEKVIQTAGEPYRVKLNYQHGNNGLYADGNDMVLVDVEVLDKEGRRCPTATHMIDFSWDGPMEWRGGIAQGPNNYVLSESLPVEGGINSVLLRTRYGKSGEMNIKAQVNGLLPDSLSWEVSPVVEKSGLFVKRAGMGLPVNMDRGNGLHGEPLKQRRITLPIQKVRAGANQEMAMASYDDNELTDWVNDGTLQSAWIEYTLDKKSDIDEIDVKLNNFRSRSYPLQVFVDDKLVFDGKTKTTLGYYTLEIPRTQGRRVKIQLKGSSVVAAENQHAEIGGKKLDDGVARDDIGANGRLSIIEIDIHKKINR
ncbi:sugar-binding domain-containing protein [Sphingobacterium haloxyli]|uniref:Beta-galactosidase n=1 Tax=Sphingobacterium haloxyli TaxID=2100533 RepID=A0A2S9J8W6_9SPHI|nr:sugar-binding domain-containing protein [Sphingobacterium haloxyli]PRD49228.1 beta-galactosidase [Sphingobacterium haloxyli]